MHWFSLPKVFVLGEEVVSWGNILFEKANICRGSFFKPQGTQGRSRCELPQGGVFMKINEITGSIVSCAIEVHTELGPGLLEEPYKRCLAYELSTRGLKVEVELGLPVTYNTIEVNLGYRIDLMVEDQIIVELKSVKEIAPIHKAQLLTYLKLSNKPVGLLLNFNTLRLRDGIARLVN